MTQETEAKIDSNGFKENYELLHDIAKKLRSQEKIDIDTLVPTIEQATTAYKICKQRLENAKLALQEHFAASLNENIIEDDNRE